MTVRICAYDEVEEYMKAPSDFVLSIRDPGREAPAAIARLPVGRKAELFFHDKIVPEAGHILPTLEHVEAIIDIGRRVLPKRSILVHCNMGISRSVAAAAIMMAAHQPARSPEEIFQAVLAIRPIAWPSSLMISMADDRLAMGGKFIAAMKELQGFQVNNQPETAAIISRVGRKFEVEEARRRSNERSGDVGRST